MVYCRCGKPTTRACRRQQDFSVLRILVPGEGFLTVHTIVCTIKVSFEWDPTKAVGNSRKHGVRFSKSVGVFNDDAAITVRDDESDTHEQRFVTVGVGLKGRILGWPDEANANSTKDSDERQLRLQQRQAWTRGARAASGSK